eukprot:1970156-Rhodomonas_salina.1
MESQLGIPTPGMLFRLNFDDRPKLPPTRRWYKCQYCSKLDYYAAATGTNFNKKQYQFEQEP